MGEIDGYSILKEDVVKQGQLQNTNYKTNSEKKHFEILRC